MCLLVQITVRKPFFFLNFQAYRQRIPRLLCELHVKDTKVDGYARYQVRIVKSEQTWDGLMAVLADHSTDGRMSGKVGNQGPRDPLQGRRSWA